MTEQTIITKAAIKKIVWNSKGVVGSPPPPFVRTRGQNSCFTVDRSLATTRHRAGRSGKS
jgi:hypothetical protein